MPQDKLCSSLSRDETIARFLQQCGWGDAERRVLAGDASFRRYDRVARPDGTHAVLMDAPPDKEDIRPFIQIADFLFGAGYSAPGLIAQDEEAGLLLLEDLGDALFNPVLDAQPEQETLLYEAAVDVLVDLARQPVTIDVPLYDDALLMKEVRLFTEWFVPHALPDASISQDSLETFESLWESAILPRARGVPDGLILRDYHADNLLWLPERGGVGRVGLLDFQDAVIGPLTYDLVSLLEDARRDVSPALAQEMAERFVRAMDSSVDGVAFEASYAIMAAQRNLKIIGIFTRLAVRDGKSHYLDFLPRVWRYLEQDVKHPVLAPCAAWLDQHVPADKRGALTL